MCQDVVRFSAMALVLCAATWTQAAHRWGLQEGTPALKSAGQLAFGPDGVLFIGDAIGAQVFAADTGDQELVATKPVRNIDALQDKLSALADGKSPVIINDLVVNPLSGNLYLSVSIGEAKSPGIVRIDSEGKLGWLSLEKIPFLQATIPNPPADRVEGEGKRARNRRPEAITDLAYVDGKLLVSGLTSEKSASKIREFPFPFADREIGTSIEIYHGAHGRLEDNAAVRTFIPMTIDGKPSLLAGFTCTPLVRFSLDSLETGEKVRGTTVAELGNRNQPLDLVAYQQGGENYLLMSNTARGVMKISTKDIGRDSGITEPIKETAGQPYETITELAGTMQLDRLSDDLIVIIQQQEGGLSLKTVMLP